MSRSIYSITLAIIIHIIIFNYQILPLESVVRARVLNTPTPQAIQNNKIPGDTQPGLSDAAIPSCAQPAPVNIKACQELEQQMLASTVRLEWHFWAKNENSNRYIYLDGNTGYATIKEGRYLVTHNHIGLSAAGLENQGLTTVSIFKADGQPIFLETSLELINIIAEDAETLVLDFGSYNGIGLFDSLGMTSPDFLAWGELPLQVGQEVAQINWNGRTAFVEWVKIDEIITENGTPRLELDNFVKHGASGGGVFWKGYHIANNWSRITVQDEDSGDIVRRFSVAALNSPKVVANLP